MQQNNCKYAQKTTLSVGNTGWIAHLTEATTYDTGDSKHGRKLKKAERRRKILLELKLRPHVRIKELARRFNASTETLRRDLDTLAKDGLIDRAHGGASAPSRGPYPNLGERTAAHVAQRQRIAELAASDVQDGETIMIDSGSTTIQLAKALAFRDVACTVITNSLPVAMTLGHSSAKVILCGGDYQPNESAVTGTETLEFLRGFHVDRCMIGASGISKEGVSEVVHGFAAVKRQMLRQAALRQLLIVSDKFDQRGLARVAGIEDIDTAFVDAKPKNGLLEALENAKVDIRIANTSASDTP